jgi:phage protein D
MSGNAEMRVPNFHIKINGASMADNLLVAVSEVAVEDEINLPGMFSIKLNTVNFETNEWQGMDLKTIKPGDEIKVAMGLDQPQDMITGEVTALEAVFGEQCYLEIRGYDRMHRLRFGTKRRSFKDMKDSDIATSIAGEAGLSAEAEDTGTVQPYLFQNDQSNYEFLLERARRIGYEMLVNDKKFMFRKSQEGKAKVLTLEYALDFRDFTARLKVLTEGSQVEVRGWDVKTKKEISGKAQSGSENSLMSGQDSGFKISESFGDSDTALPFETVVDATEAAAIAKAQYNLLLKEFMNGEGSCLGNPQIRAGNTIEIKGIGDRFSGIYYVISSSHIMNRTDGYMTKFKVKRTGI